MARLWLVLAIVVSLGATGAASSRTTARPVPRTLLAAKAPIHGFAQDTGSIAWIDSSYAVHVRKLSAKHGTIVGKTRLPRLRGVSRTPPLALAGMQALWPSYDAGNFLYTHVWTGSPRHGPWSIWDAAVIFGGGQGDGSFLTGMSGDGATLVFGAVGQRCDDEYNCRRLDATGSVMRATTKATDLPGLPAPVLLATSDGRIALVPAKTPRFFPDLGAPRADEYAPVEVFDAAGQLLSTVIPPGTPRSIALSWPKLAVLFENVDGSREIQLYDARTGSYWFSGGEGVFAKVPVTVTRVAVGSAGAVYSVGNRIFLLSRQPTRLVWQARGVPIGLSIDGRRIAWAENVGKPGLIRALTVPR